LELLKVLYEVISPYVYWIILTPLVIFGGVLLILPFEIIGGRINKFMEKAVEGKPILSKLYTGIGFCVIIGWAIGLVYVLEKFM
jgi:hypothetical protein